MDEVKNEKVVKKSSTQRVNASTNSNKATVKKSTQGAKKETTVKKTAKPKVEQTQNKKNIKTTQLKNNKENSVSINKKSITQKENKELVKKKNNNVIVEKKVVTKKRVSQKREELEQLIEQEVEQLTEFKIDTIEQELRKNNKLSKDEIKNVNKAILPNIVVGIVLVIYYIFILLGYNNIEANNYIIDLKVFSGIFLIVTIYLFEKAYKKDNNSIAIYGIESLILTIFNFSLIYMYYAYFNIYKIIISTFTIGIVLYYIGKSIFRYFKIKEQYLIEKSDIK